MRIFDANSWEQYEEFIASKKVTRSIKALKGKINRKEKEKKILGRNASIKGAAKYFARDMRNAPSELEKRMQRFLDNHNVKYDFQRIFYIKKRDGEINKFYIADFYIPAKNLVIETDGAFHDQQVKEDTLRTIDIQRHYPNIKVVRWRWHDFDSSIKIQELIRNAV